MVGFVCGEFKEQGWSLELGAGGAWAAGRAVVGLELITGSHFPPGITEICL